MAIRRHLMRRIDRICKKYSVSTVVELVQLADDDDQQLMHSREWDYKVDSLNTRIVDDLKRVPRKELVGDEMWQVEQVIWFWYHHATSCAIYRHNDRKQALYFVKKALRYQARIPAHPNKVTHLLYLLLKGRLSEAKALVPTMNEDEVETGRELVEEWKE